MLPAMQLQLLLKEEFRHPDGIRAASEAAAAVGIRPVASGYATLSGDIAPETFQTVFPGELPESGALLTVPASLKHCIESISMPPPHILLKNERG